MLKGVSHEEMKKKNAANVSSPESRAGLHPLQSHRWQHLNSCQEPYFSDSPIIVLYRWISIPSSATQESTGPFCRHLFSLEFVVPVLRLFKCAFDEPRDPWLMDRSCDQKLRPPVLNRGRRFGRHAAMMLTPASVQVHMTTGIWLSVRILRIMNLGLELRGSLTGNVITLFGHTDHCYQASYVEDKSTASLWAFMWYQATRAGNTYSPPTMNTKDNSSFWFLPTGSDQTTPCGISKRIKSETMFGICVP